VEQRSVPGYVPGKKNPIESCRGQRLFNWVTIVKSWPLHLGGISWPPGTTAIPIFKNMQIYGCHATNQVHCKDSWENNYSKVPIISITLRVVFVLARLTGDASGLLVFSVIFSFG